MMKSLKYCVTLFLSLGLSCALANDSGHKIQQLLSAHGAQVLAQFVMSKRHGEISIDQGGYINNVRGKPNPDLVTVKSLKNDLYEMGLSEEEFAQELASWQLKQKKRQQKEQETERKAAALEDVPRAPEANLSEQEQPKKESAASLMRKANLEFREAVARQRRCKYQGKYWPEGARVDGAICTTDGEWWGVYQKALIRME